MRVVIPKYENYEDRIGNTSDAVNLLTEMIEKCQIKPGPDYNDIEKGMFAIVKVSHNYFLPRLETLKDAIERGII